MKIYLFLPILLVFFAFSPKEKARPTPKLYQSQQPVFSFEYAGNAILETVGQAYPKIRFPLLESESNLTEKSLTIVVQQGNNNCPDATNYAAGTTPENVNINGVSFQKWESFKVQAGNMEEIVEYATHKQGYCICFRFVFHSVQSDNVAQPFQEKGRTIAEVMATMQM